MTSPLYIIDPKNNATSAFNQPIDALETGKILYLPDIYYHSIAADKIISYAETVLDRSHKNISFDFNHLTLSGYDKATLTTALKTELTEFMQGYAQFAHALVAEFLPEYSTHLIWGRTSYRPAEIKGRPSSKRKDDTRLHVDAFAATPVNGLRILRIFCNINPFNQPRVWQVGDAFEQVVKHFSPRLPAYNALKAKCLHWFRATKTLRSAYDHYQLHLHDCMKLDEVYQQTVVKHPVNFQAQSSWIVYTDYVSHAALNGQYLLEQTFYLPLSAMKKPGHAPFNHWQQAKAIA